jgi:hypothetical protein
VAKFVVIGYGDRAGYERTAPAVRDAARAQDSRLAAAGAVLGRAGSPVQVRNPEGTGVEQTPGRYARSDLPIAGFAVIEAADLDEAVRLVSGTPSPVAHGVAEVWPLEASG